MSPPKLSDRLSREE